MKLTGLHLNCHFGDELKEVYVNPNVMGSGGYQVLINGFYQGDLFLKEGKWLSYSERFTMDDIQALGELIEAENIIK